RLSAAGMSSGLARPEPSGLAFRFDDMLALLLALSITWPEFFGRISSEGLTYSDKLRGLEGKRVQLRGYALRGARIDGGLLLTRFPEMEPHEETELEVPFDAVAVIWRTSIKTPPVPARPTVEGVLRLGNHTWSGLTVAVTLDDALPVVSRKSR
ncbi:MAG: hypothetical protein ACXVH7_13040, partial [Thermoanaerobaculia bacterium]